MAVLRAAGQFAVVDGDPTDAAYERWFVETTLALQSRPEPSVAR